ncbi:MAG: secretin N-terminal domain-containing protein [Pirellulales bacterium]
MVALVSLPARPATGQLAPQQAPAGYGANPAPPGTPQQPPQIEAYPLDDISRDVFLAWQQYAAGRQDLRIAIDERTSQVLVSAAAGIHAQIRQQLAAKTAAQAPPVGLSAPAGTVFLQLSNVPATELHTRFERLLSRQLPATADASGEWQGFSVEASPGVGVAVNVNTRTGQVRIDGPPLQVAAWRRVVEVLDSAPTAPGTVTQMVATKSANHERVRKTLHALQTGSAGSKAADSLVAMLFQQQNDAAAQPETNPPAPAAQPPGTPPVTPDAQTALEAAKIAEAAGGLLGPVQVEFVEGLDVIVLRGTERDVQRVLEIINQIEQLSEIAVPSIEIHELRFVESVQLAALLTRLYAADGALGSRVGGVSITPLGKPNALLLIGRAENVKTAIELIQRLDQPVVPTSRFEVFPLRHASAAEAKTLIDAYLRQDDEGSPLDEEPDLDTVTHTPPTAPRAIVVADVRTNSLVISAGARDLAEIAALVARIDTPGATAELKVFTIINGDAEALAQMLRSLFSVPETGEAPEGGGLAQGGPVRMQFSVDPRTNSIIAAGSREDLAVVEAILLRLDEGELRERVTTVHRLNNAFAENVAQALTQWLQTERQVEAQADLAISPFEQIEREVIIVPELATNSLIVSATPRFYNEIIRVIRELDERPPMVLIQVLIAEVRLNDTDEFGIELGLQDSLLFDRSLLGDFQTITNTTQQQGAGGAVLTTTQQQIVNAPGQPGFNFNNQPLGNNLSSTALATAANVAAQGLSSFSLNRVNGDLGFGGFVFSASSNSVSVLLRALQEKRRLEVLSRPQLMALDGQQGYVQVGQDVPRILATNIDTFGGQTNTITYEPVGLILQVVPRISPDGLVVLQIQANKSEVGPEAEGIPISVSAAGQVLRAPRIEKTQALTTVSALSGQTVVLGGLLQTRKFDVHRRVPIVADIPLLGNLFRYDSVAEERRELLIILTPQIIYNKFDSDLVKQIESSRMSWILSDVVNLHGEAGLRSRCDEWYDGEMESVYPTFVPEEGILPLSPGSLLLGEPGAGAPACEPVPALSPPPNGETLPSPALMPPAANP